MHQKDSASGTLIESGEAKSILTPHKLQMCIIIGNVTHFFFLIHYFLFIKLFPNLVCFFRIFVATWNVAGKSPPSYLSLEDWLHTSPPADIYVLGYVPD